MKFLCVPCNSPMKLQTVGPPGGGSLSVVFSCPECGYEMAMLTNPYETQLVQSLGVRIAPAEASAEPGIASASNPAPVSDSSSTSRCPLPSTALGAGPAIVPSMEAAPEDAGRTIRWTSGAEARLANIPAFVRPMARTGIEKYAQERGATEVDEKLLDEARQFFGM